MRGVGTPSARAWCCKPVETRSRGPPATAVLGIARHGGLEVCEEGVEVELLPRERRLHRDDLARHHLGQRPVRRQQLPHAAAHLEARDVGRQNVQILGHQLEQQLLVGHRVRGHAEACQRGHPELPLRPRNGRAADGPEVGGGLLLEPHHRHRRVHDTTLGPAAGQQLVLQQQRALSVARRQRIERGREIQLAHGHHHRPRRGRFARHLGDVLPTRDGHHPAPRALRRPREHPTHLPETDHHDVIHPPPLITRSVTDPARRVGCRDVGR
jgi:hypothetical protein